MIYAMRFCGKKYRDAGYGGKFYFWLLRNDKEPYGNYGNGSAMRVSFVGWVFETLERTCEVARWSAEVTHNHLEGIKGAESTATVIWLARNGANKAEIKSMENFEWARMGREH